MSQDLLKQMCGTSGCDSQRFRGYRTRIEYPIFNSELLYVIDVPLAPSVAAP